MTMNMKTNAGRSSWKPVTGVRGRWVFQVVAAVLLTWAGPLAAQVSPERQVMQLSRDKFRWLVSGKTDSLRAMLDPRVQYVHSNGWSQNRDEILADLASGKLVYQAIEVKSATARLYARTAIVTGTGTFTVLMSGKPLVIELGYTEVYIRAGKKWLLASRHANRMNP